MKKKVYVGMSGGVDSSVSALLLLKQGYDVTGVYIKTWTPEWLPCTWRDERRDAMRVAAVLGIPFKTLDLEKEYKEKVAEYMINSYKIGETPNPDILCNKEIKFGSFLDWAKKDGADFIATGHYARHNGNNVIEGEDKNKDQSYFLWTLTPSVLSHVIFPVGDLNKDEVRDIARDNDLPTANKKDSQGICFLGDVDMKEFLSHYIEKKKGVVLNLKGEEIGYHDGAVFYTIGERHGFTIIKKSASDKPFYVLRKDIKSNTLIVGPKNEMEESEMNGHLVDIKVKKMLLKNIIWNTKDTELDCLVRIRYRQYPVKAHIKKIHAGGEYGLEVILENPEIGVAIGQSAVIYKEEVLIGGGIISAVK